MSEGIKVVSILGEDYSIKAPAGEDKTLMHAVTLLKASLATTKKKYPTLIGDKLLVLAALNLCAEQIEMQQGAVIQGRLVHQVSGGAVKAVELKLASNN